MKRFFYIIILALILVPAFAFVSCASVPKSAFPPAGVYSYDFERYVDCVEVTAVYKSYGMDAYQTVPKKPFGNAVDNNGNTALSNCCYAGYTKKVRLLLKHGADPTILDNEGHNCLMGECTKKSLFPSLVELVCSHGVDINQTADYNDIYEEDKDWGLAEFQAHYEHFENVLWLLDRADYKHKDLPHLTKIAKLASYSKKGTEVLIYCLEHGVALTDGMVASIKNSKNKAMLNYLQEHGGGR